MAVSDGLVHFKRRRGDLIGAVALETGKIFSEADVEVSEAIDFGNYYIYSFNKMQTENANVEFTNAYCPEGNVMGDHGKGTFAQKRKE